MSSLTPVEVLGLSDVVQINTYDGHTCALRANGQVACWGDGQGGAIGDGTRDNRLSPYTIASLSELIDITTGLSHSCALQSDGSVWCWGFNFSRQIGVATETFYQTTPIRVTGVTGVTEIEAGSSYSCGAGSAGLTCWGNNSDGQLGNGTTGDRVYPVTSARNGIVEIAGGTGHTCARFESGPVQCWGYGGRGQLGNRSDASSLTPVDVYGIADVRQLVGAGSHACVLIGDAVRCWGGNSDGELGDGTRNDAIAPVAVLLPE
jgi:alpha-tubulin suppressor-like RCC1 family protein